MQINVSSLRNRHSVWIYTLAQRVEGEGEGEGEGSWHLLYRPFLGVLQLCRQRPAAPTPVSSHSNMHTTLTPNCAQRGHTTANDPKLVWCSPSLRAFLCARAVAKLFEPTVGAQIWLLTDAEGGKA